MVVNNYIFPGMNFTIKSVFFNRFYLNYLYYYPYTNYILKVNIYIYV